MGAPHHDIMICIAEGVELTGRFDPNNAMTCGAITTAVIRATSCADGLDVLKRALPQIDALSLVSVGSVRCVSLKQAGEELPLLERALSEIREGFDIGFGTFHLFPLDDVEG